MNAPALSNSPIITRYREHTPGSARLAERAQTNFPSGITHDSRHLAPYGLFIEQAQGPRKRDVDGNEYVDYFGGHGALLLGHGHPQVLAKAHETLSLGTHFGSNHALEVEWADKIRSMVPGIEKIRFTSSGTEATHMALRLARAFTGRSAIVRFRGHFHGWHDHMSSGYTSHFDGSATPGVVPGINDDVILVDPNDEAGVSAALTGEKPIAAVILEPIGASSGMIPTAPGFIEFLREQTRAHGAVLIFDEVVTGFRVAPGGAQAHYGVTPDLSTYAKIVAGGLPGGCVGGREEILERLDFEVAERKGFEKISHQGTYNANPLSASAGLAALSIIDSTDACARANDYGERLRAQMNEVLDDEGVAWSAYGEFSVFHLFTNPQARALSPREFDPHSCEFGELKANAPGVVQKLRLAMILNGVDITGSPGGVISAVHEDADLEQTVSAFRESLRMMKAEGAIAV